MAGVSIDHHVRRLAQLKRKRQIIEQNWRECYDVTYPIRGAQLALSAGGGNAAMDENAAHSYARQQAAKNLTSLPGECVRTLASALVSGTTPGSSRWVAYGLDGMDDDDLPDEERIWLDESADTIWKNIHVSNFDAVHFEAEIDTCNAGLFYLFIDEAPDGGYVFEQWGVASVWAAASMPGGPLDTFYREVQITAEQAVKTYEENCSGQVKQKAQNSPDELVTIVHCIYPRPGPHGHLSKNLPFASVHYERDTRQMLREKGYHECPISAPRWLVVPNTVYTLGPVFDALPDIKSLNKAIELSFANMDLALAGMWIAEDDGVLNPRTLKVGPRKVVVANSVDSMKALEPPGNFQLGAIEIDRLERAIRRVLMADQLTPQPQPGKNGQPGAPITATQAQINVELIRQLLGPIYMRWLSELVQPMLKRCFGIAMRAGALKPPPESMHGKTLNVRYRSPIARSQQLVDVAAMDRFETTLAQEMAAGRAEVADNYNWDKAARKRAELLAVPADLLIDEDERDAQREKRAQQAAGQQAAAAAAPMMAEAMKGAQK